MTDSAPASVHDQLRGNGATSGRATTLAQLKNAYALRDDLDAAWALRPLALVEEDGQPKLLQDDSDGQPLDELIDRLLGIKEFLRIAIGLAVALGCLHKRGLIHKDIKPANVVANLSTGQVWVGRFRLLLGRAARASGARSHSN